MTCNIVLLHAYIWNCLPSAGPAGAPPSVLLKGVGYLCRVVDGKAGDRVGKILKEEIKRAFYYGDVSSNDGLCEGG